MRSVEALPTVGALAGAVFAGVLRPQPLRSGAAASSALHSSSVSDDWAKEMSAKGHDGKALIESARALIKQYTR